MSFLVLAFPELSLSESRWLNSYKKTNDEIFSTVKPHFTIVFAVEEIEEPVFVEEIKQQSINLKAIEFRLNKLLVVKDSFRDYYHEFLVPDKGYSEIKELHDKLYSNKLQQNLRTDIEYIPHITIGSSKDINISKSRNATLNSISISGKIKELTIISYIENTISKIASIRLID